MIWIWWSLAVAVALLAVDRVATLAERRGWIYWRTRKPSASGGSGITGDLMTALQPSQQVVQRELDHRDMLGDEIRSDEPGTPSLWTELGDGGAWTAPHRGR